MGSHFVRVCSVDERRLKSALRSNDQAILHEWQSAIRKHGEHWQEKTRIACEEAAGKMVAGDFSAGEAEDGAAFGHALEALCSAWSAAQAVLECYVDEDWPQLWDFVVEAEGPPLGIPTSPSGVPGVSWHIGPEIARHRQAFAAVDLDEGDLENFGATAENLAELDKVLADAEQSGRAVIVFWSV